MQYLKSVTKRLYKEIARTNNNTKQIPKTTSQQAGSWNKW